MSDSVDFECRDRVGIVRLCRPERANALSREMVVELGRLGQAILKMPELRAVILTGVGDRAFSAGADLKERQSMSKEEVATLLEQYDRDLSWVDTAPVPVVAAINGAALGGGFELALMCDFRVAASQAVLGLPEVGLGIIPGAGGTQRLTWLLGEARAKELILFGRRLSATEALTLGLVHRVTAEGVDVLQDALTYVEPLLQGAPIAQRAALAAIDAARTHHGPDGLKQERLAYGLCLASEDRIEALQALSERRPPRFRGR